MTPWFIMAQRSALANRPPSVAPPGAPYTRLEWVLYPWRGGHIRFSCVAPDWVPCEACRG